MRMPFDSPEAKKLNAEIFETIYYAAARCSCDIAKRDGPYSSFADSPASKGILCPDMWNIIPTNRWPYNELRQDIVEYGLRNSLLNTCMPTASTSQILGNNECIEPFTTNIYSRRVLAGEFIVINKYLIADLIALGLWNPSLKNKIIANGGSVQGIPEIPKDIQLLYRTVWELKMRDLVDMSADRGAFIDQTQSFNAFMEVPTKEKLTSFHFYGWKKGLKTGMYYLRTRPAVNAIQFTVDKKAINDEPKKEEVEEFACTMEEGCFVCGS
jgi:ribonucleotide reductase alpha subunit